MESKGDEKGTQAEASVKQFGANTPTVSCTFDREFIRNRDFRNAYFYFYFRVSILLTLSLIFIAESNAYHLRVYVYQARNLTALDKDSFSGVIAVLILLIQYVF